MKIWTATAVLAAGWLAGCGTQHEEPAAAPEPPEATVSVTEARLVPGLRTQEIPGTVRSVNEAVISSKIQGQIEAVLVVPGQMVEAGALLVRLNAEELRARKERAEAELRQAEIEFERIEQLVSREAATRREYDNADLALRAARAALLEAETFLGYTTIRAPFTGIISEKRVEVGDLANPGLPLVSMYDPTQFRLEARIPESRANQLELGDTFEVRVETLGLTVTGEVEEISPLADPTSRTVLTKIALPPATGIQSGQFGRLLLPFRDGTALVAPERAIIRRGQLDYVFVVENREESPRAWLRLIKTGRRIGEQREVISGLRPGETIVVADLDKLEDGQKVKPTRS